MCKDIDIVYIYGPQGCGKTFNSKKIMEYFGCIYLVDEWNHDKKVKKGSLVLTNNLPKFLIKRKYLKGNVKFYDFTSIKDKLSLEGNNV